MLRVHDRGEGGQGGGAPSVTLHGHPPLEELWNIAGKIGPGPVADEGDGVAHRHERPRLVP